MSAEQVRAAGPGLRSVVLPAQHGGWSFVLEPILVGLLLAPSASGALLSVAALMVFLLDQPLRVAAKDHRKGKRYARTRLAERTVLVYAVIGLGSFVAAVALAAHPFWLPLLLALPFALIQLALDLQNQARSAAAEIGGALAFAAVAPALALMAGWPLELAFGLWVALALRDASAILYVRARLRLEKGKPVQTGLALWAHALLVAGLLVLALLTLAPWLAVIGGLLLSGRAVLGLSRRRAPATAVQVGLREVGFGFAFCGLLVFGVWIA